MSLFHFLQHASNLEQKQNETENKKVHGDVVKYGTVIQVTKKKRKRKVIYQVSFRLTELVQVFPDQFCPSEQPFLGSQINTFKLYYFVCEPKKTKLFFSLLHLSMKLDLPQSKLIT